jgi:hypothetical protein
LITLAIGAGYLERFERLSLPLWRIYAERNNLGLAALIEPYDDPGEKRFDWQKLLVGKALRSLTSDARRACFIDYDIIPNPFSPDIFFELDPGLVGFVSQRKSLPYGGVDDVLRRVAFFRNKSSRGEYPLDSYLTASPEKIFIDHGLSPYFDYGCGGLFMFDIYSHSAYLEGVFYRGQRGFGFEVNPGEEVYLNHALQSLNELRWLSYKWHAIWQFEMAWSYPWLYKKENQTIGKITDAIVSTISRVNFLHFVGSWEKWAWEYCEFLSSPEVLIELEALAVFNRRRLESPSLGLIFPSDAKDRRLISK